MDLSAPQPIKSIVNENPRESQRASIGELSRTSAFGWRTCANQSGPLKTLEILEKRRRESENFGDSQGTQRPLNLVVLSRPLGTSKTLPHGISSKQMEPWGRLWNLVDSCGTSRRPFWNLGTRASSRTSKNLREPEEPEKPSETLRNFEKPHPMESLGWTERIVPALGVLQDDQHLPQRVLSPKESLREHYHNEE